MTVLFSLSLLLLIYTFIGYPILLAIVSLFFNRKPKKEPQTPHISFIVSAYNEEAVIREKIHNTFALDYPPELLEFIVVSDGSTDGTDDIVREYEYKGVRLVRVEGRKGKTYCQNRAAREARGSVLVFSDANSMYDHQAVRELVANFTDENVGVVCGELRYIAEPGKQERLYWKMEVLLKQLESKIGSCLGVNGAMYAIPKHLFVPLQDHLQSDLIEPFLVYKKGYRVVYDSTAFCTEQAESNHVGFHRKRRIMHGAFLSFWELVPFLNVFRYRWYSITLLSHKVLRWLSSFFLMVLFISSASLTHHPVIGMFFVLQCMFLFMALAGTFMQAKPFSIAYYMMVTQVASLAAIADTLSGKKRSTWDTTRKHV
jgi:cellulose synthase/poly-beta-1,6-N-acetylglucosamine synthase-like glycosyltransferase